MPRISPPEPSVFHHESRDVQMRKGGGIHLLLLNPIFESKPLMVPSLVKLRFPNTLLDLQVSAVHHESLSLLLTTTTEQQIILGLPWLKKHDLIISCQLQEIWQWSKYCLQHCIEKPWVQIATTRILRILRPTLCLDGTCQYPPCPNQTPFFHPPVLFTLSPGRLTNRYRVHCHIISLKELLTITFLSPISGLDSSHGLTPSLVLDTPAPSTHMTSSEHDIGGLTVYAEGH